MTDLYWDEVLLSHNPDSKELEVSFKKIDGSGVLYSGNEPGTPGGTKEDPEDENGGGACRNETMIVSPDVFALQDYAAHWIYIATRSAPIEYMEIDIQFSDGTLEYPEYGQQTMTVELVRDNFRINGNGPDYITQLELVLGDVEALEFDEEGNPVPENYIAQIVAVRGFADGDNTPCFNPDPISINFAAQFAGGVVPPFGGGGGGGGIPGNNPECLPQDCSAFEEYASPPSVNSAYFWNTSSDSLPTDSIPGMSRRVCDRYANTGRTTTISRSLYREANAQSGPCDTTLKLYAINTKGSVASNYIYMPDEVWGKHDLPIGPGGDIECEGEATFHFSFRNRDGELPTYGKKSVSVLWLANKIITNQGIYNDWTETRTGEFEIVQDSDSGECYLEVDNRKVLINNSGDASGSYSVYFRTTATRSLDGESIALTTYGRVRGGGAEIEFSDTAAGIVGNVAEFVAIQSNREYTSYLKGGTASAPNDGVFLTASQAGGTEGEVQAWINAYERSLLDYTPPTYCERIPT